MSFQLILDQRKVYHKHTMSSLGMKLNVETEIRHSHTGTKWNTVQHWRFSLFFLGFLSWRIRSSESPVLPHGGVGKLNTKTPKFIIRWLKNRIPWPERGGYTQTQTQELKNCKVRLRHCLRSEAMEALTGLSEVHTQATPNLFTHTSITEPPLNVNGGNTDSRLCRFTFVGKLIKQNKISLWKIIGCVFYTTDVGDFNVNHIFVKT